MYIFLQDFETTQKIYSALDNQNFIIYKSTLVISKMKGPSETLRDIRILTYQICIIEENTIEQPNFTNEHVI